MAKILKSVLYIVVVLLLLAAVATGLFLLAWWAGWPMTSVVMIPVAAIALLLVVFGIRKLWRWKNRTLYVRTVLREDPSRIDSKKSGELDTTLQRAWNRGMQYFGNLSGAMGQSAIYRHPWVMVLGDGQSKAHAFAACQAQSFENPETDAPLHWHFLPDTVLLEPSPHLLENGKKTNDWESLLAKISTTRTKEPINGFVVVVDAQRLVQAGNPQQDDLIRALAATIRSRIDDVLVILPARVPVRIVVTGLETLPGGARLAMRLGRKTANQWLGCEFAPPSVAHETIQYLGKNGPSGTLAVQYALDGAKSGLQRIIIEEAGLGTPPDGDDLYAPSHLNTLHDGLVLFLEALMRPSACPNMPFLRGIHFTAFIGSTEKAQVAKAVFADGILRRLPDDRNLTVCVSRPSLRDIPLSMTYAGLCLLLLALCACFASNVLHSHRVLGNQQKISTPADVPDRLMVFVATSARLHQLKEAEKFWWVPSLGLNRVPAEIARLQSTFINDMRDTLLPAFLAECKSGQSGHFPYAALQHLLWMQEMLDGADRQKVPFPIGEKPVSRIQEDFWSLRFGRLYLDFLDWSSDADKRAFRDRLTDAIRGIVGQDEENIFNHVLTLVNANTPQWDIPISRFWANVPRGSKKFTAIVPAYTATGYARLSENMRRLTENTGRSFRDAPYWKQYLGEYDRAWAEFVAKSDQTWNDLDRVDSLLQLAVKPASKDDPYFRLMQTVVDEFQPLRHDGVAPSWVEDLALLQALWRVSELATRPQGLLAGKEVPGTATILWNVATKLQAVDLDVLQKRLADVNKLTPLVDAVKAMNAFQAALEELFQTTRDLEGSLELARIEFGGKEYGDPTATATTKARKALNDIATVLGFATQWGTAHVRRDGTRTGQAWTTSPAQRVLGGSMRFLQYLAGCHAALAIQSHWESDVLPQTALLPPDADTDALFGVQGLVNKFMGDQLKPFLTREVGSFKPRLANGTSFPFTSDFLTFLQTGQMAQSHPKKESYEVPIKTSTASLNSEAMEHLQYYELQLAGTEGAQVLRNSNYPMKGKFTYSEKDCGNVTLEISFPSLTLRFGYDSFPSFLEDFAHGERVFTVEDFPDAVERLEALKIKQITVRILPQNSLEILEAFKDEIIVPSRITGVW